MDLHKLRLENFSTYNGFNLPDDFNPELELSESPQVYFLFLDDFEQVNRYTNQVINNQNHKDNRIFFIYKKGNKSFHRDHIMAFAQINPNLTWKAPMICSLDKIYSSLTFMVKK